MRTIVHLIPSLDGGGAERQLAMLAAAQAQGQWRVHIVTRRSGVFGGSLERRLVALHVLGDRRGASPLLLARIVASLREIKPDIVQTWLPQMDVLGGRAALWCGIPWVIAERSSRMAFEGRNWWSAVRRYLGRRANAIVANSAGGAVYWRAVAPRARFVEVIPNAVDVEQIREAALSGDMPTTDQNKTFLVVGRLGQEKCIDVAIEAIRLIHDECSAELLIVGSGPMHGRLTAQICAARLCRRVRMIPFQAQWWAMLRGATGLINMSGYEGQPNVVLEAMAAECPLIVSDIPAHREILDDESAMFVRPHDSVCLGTAIKTVLANAAGARERAAKAFASVAGRSARAMANGYEAVYERVLASR